MDRVHDGSVTRVTVQYTCGEKAEDVAALLERYIQGDSISTFYGKVERIRIRESRVIELRPVRL